MFGRIKNARPTAWLVANILLLCCCFIGFLKNNIFNQIFDADVKNLILFFTSAFLLNILIFQMRECIFYVILFNYHASYRKWTVEDMYL